MKKNIRRAIGATSFAMFLGLPWVASMLGACDTPLPAYAVQSTTMRLIPDAPTVSSQGGDVLVVLELARSPDAGPVHFTTVVQAFGASLMPLPGGVLCSPPDGGGGAAAQGPSSMAASVPQEDYRASDNQVNTYDSAITVGVPAGTSDVLVVAAAYQQTDAAASTCSGSEGTLLAFGSTRITRALAEEAGAEGASSADAALGDDGGAEADEEGSTGSSDATTDAPAESGGDDGGEASTFTDGSASQ